MFLIAVLTDWYDGWHARKFKVVSKFGIFIDPFADKVLTSFSFVLFYYLNIVQLWMIIIIITRDFLITLLRFYDELQGYSLKTSFLAKSKTFLQMSYIFIILSLLYLSSLNIDPGLTDTIKSFLAISNPVNFSLMAIITFLTLYTGISYFIQKKFKKIEILKKEENN